MKIYWFGLLIFIFHSNVIGIDRRYFEKLCLFVGGVIPYGVYLPVTPQSVFLKILLFMVIEIMK